MKKNYAKFLLLLFTGISILILLTCATSCSKKEAKINSVWNFEKYPDLPLQNDGFDYCFDQNMNLHAVYRTDDEIKYARLNGSKWQIETVNIERRIGYCSSAISVDNSNKPHILYESSYYGELQYAYKNGDYWKTEPVQYQGTFESLSTDKEGKAHICFINRSDGYIKYAHKEKNKFTVESIEYMGLNSAKDKYKDGIKTSIILDSSGNPNIAYMNYHLGNLFFTRKYNSVWTKNPPVDKDGDYTGLYASLTLDSSDSPQIVYMSPEAGGVKFAYFLNSCWIKKTVDKKGGVYSSIAMGQENKPCIAYFTPDFKDLRFSSATLWSPEIVEDRRDLQKSTNPGGIKLRIDSKGIPHILYYDFGRNCFCHFYKK
jgi:hypothetical protein